MLQGRVTNLFEPFEAYYEDLKQVILMAIWNNNHSGVCGVGLLRRPAAPVEQTPAWLGLLHSLTSHGQSRMYNIEHRKKLSYRLVSI